jgi:integrase
VSRARPVQDVRIWSIQVRRKSAKIRWPYVVRWVVDGLKPHYSKSFETLGQAEDYRSRLVLAHRSGEWFDPKTGEPGAWAPTQDQQHVYLWARQWVSHEWSDWAPRSRVTTAKDLARFLELLAVADAPEPPEGLRLYLRDSLVPDIDVSPDDECERWLTAWTLRLTDLSREVLADVERRLRLLDNGKSAAPNTSRRRLATAHSCIRRAVELGKLDADPWPPTPKGRARRKAARRSDRVDVKRLPDPETTARILRGMLTDRAALGPLYQAMSVVMYYAGLRPSEVAMLQVRALTLPAEGWGRMRVIETDDGTGTAADPKTGERWVPISAELVVFLRAWIDRHELTPGDYLFRHPDGQVPNPSTWGVTVRRGCAATGWPMMRPYDFRHACATTWLGAGVGLGECARRMGHSVEVLVSVYAGALEGDDLEANRRIDDACRMSSGWLLKSASDGASRS